MPLVRPAGPDDGVQVAELLYVTAGGMYDRFAGDRVTALRLLLRAFDTAGNNASMEVVTVAELDGRVAGAVASFPVEEGAARARRFMGITFLQTPFWRWPGALRIYRLGGRAAPRPPLGSMYVDALATDEAFRRRGVARALLAGVEERARASRLTRVALETELTNSGAQALYEGAGFVAVERRGPGGGLPGFVAYVKELRPLR